MGRGESYYDWKLSLKKEKKPHEPSILIIESDPTTIKKLTILFHGYVTIVRETMEGAFSFFQNLDMNRKKKGILLIISMTTKDFSMTQFNKLLTNFRIYFFLIVFITSATCESLGLREEDKQKLDFMITKPIKDSDFIEIFEKLGNRNRLGITEPGFKEYLREWKEKKFIRILFVFIS
ncbi:MAG: hypothetical protein ACFFBI_05830 [Promethearchaeota archaeon]